jgi:RHS repeat-associated protein
MHALAATKAFAVVALIACGATSCTDLGGGEGAETSEAVTLSIGLTNQLGRVTSSGNGLSRTFYSYDARRRTVATQHVLDGTSYVYTTAYGFPCATDACTGVSAPMANGSVAISETFPDTSPDNEVVRYTFDAGGASQSITATPSGGTMQTIVRRVLRNARGQTIEVDSGDGTTTTHHYNDTTDLRLYQLETFLTATPSTIVQLYTYAFDPNGNVTGVNDYCNEASTTGCTTSAANAIYSWSYQYDSRNQLVKGTRNGVVYAYGYDALGNLTNKEGVTQTYPGVGQPRPHALSAVGAVKYAYDANGDVTGTSGGTTNFSIAWNADDMPERTVYGSVTANKSFLGESLWKKAQGTNTTYYLPSMRVENKKYRKYFGTFAERDGADTSSCTTNAARGCLKFYHGDHLGSSTLVTNDAGAVIHRQSYKPYGEDLLASPPGSFTPAAGLRYQFNFKEKEQDGSGFYDYGARMYNPATGNFLSADSHDADGLNRYRYVRNNPLRYTDPTGHDGDVYTVDKKGKVHLTTTVTVTAEAPKAKAIVYTDPHPMQPWLSRPTMRFAAREEAAYFRRLGYQVTMTNDYRDVRTALLMDFDVKAIAVNAHGNGQGLYTNDGDAIVEAIVLWDHPLDILIANACNTSTDTSSDGLRGAKTVSHFIGNIGPSDAFTDLWLGALLSNGSHGDPTRLAGDVHYIDEDHKTRHYYLYKVLSALRTAAYPPPL